MPAAFMTDLGEVRISEDECVALTRWDHAIRHGYATERESRLYELKVADIERVAKFKFTN